jgi:hypothetical protein
MEVPEGANGSSRRCEWKFFELSTDFVPEGAKIVPEGAKIVPEGAKIVPEGAK